MTREKEIKVRCDYGDCCAAHHCKSTATRTLKAKDRGFGEWDLCKVHALDCGYTEQDWKAAPKAQ